jgi:hypothetical protein
MNAYTDMGEISVDDNFIRYIQVGDGPLVSVADHKAADLFASSPRAQELFADKKYNKAVARYNKTGD